MALLFRLVRSIGIRFTRFRNRARSAYWRSLLTRGGSHVGSGFLVRGGAVFDVAFESSVSFGKNVVIAEGAAIHVGTGGILDIGDGVFIGRNSVLVANRELRVGSGTQIAHGVTVIDTDHGFGDPESPLVVQGQRSAPIRIGKEVWIGAQAVILKGRTVGDRAVVGAGSVVTRDLGPAKIGAGNPVRELR